MRLALRLVITILALCVIAGCAFRDEKMAARRTGPVKMKVVGESVVLPGIDARRLCFGHVVKGPVTVRSSYLSGQSNTVIYIEGSDYVVDYANGSIQRTAGSRIPDYTTYPLYGLKEFDHSKFKDFSNQKWFVWVDYQTTHGVPFVVRDSGAAAKSAELLAESRRKLKAGGPFRIVSYGDSRQQRLPRYTSACHRLSRHTAFHMGHEIHSRRTLPPLFEVNLRTLFEKTPCAALLPPKTHWARRSAPPKNTLYVLRNTLRHTKTR
jgi:hypothetical protein